MKLEKDEKISTNRNLMSGNNEPSARREGVLRGRTAFRAGAMNSVPPPKPTSLGTFLFGDKKVPRRRQPCWSYSAQNGIQAIENLCLLPLLFRILKGSTLDSHFNYRYYAFYRCGTTGSVFIKKFVRDPITRYWGRVEAGKDGKTVTEEEAMSVFNSYQ